MGSHEKNAFNSEWLSLKLDDSFFSAEDKEEDA